MFSWAIFFKLFSYIKKLLDIKVRKSFNKFGKYILGGKNSLFLGLEYQQNNFVLVILVIIVKGVCPRLLSSLSLARANLNKSKLFLTNTTAASKHFIQIGHWPYCGFHSCDLGNFGYHSPGQWKITVDILLNQNGID